MKTDVGQAYDELTIVYGPLKRAEGGPGHQRRALKAIQITPKKGGELPDSIPLTYSPNCPLTTGNYPLLLSYPHAYQHVGDL